MMPSNVAELKLKADGRFWYLASPYTHKLAHMQEQRTHAATVHLGALLAAGVFVFSPIVQTHRASQLFQLPGNFEWWLDFNKAFMDASAGTILAQMEGMNESRGVAQEIEYTRESGKPCYQCCIDEHGLPLIYRRF